LSTLLPNLCLRSEVAFGDVFEELRGFVVSRVALVVMQIEHGGVDVVVYGHPVLIED